MLKLIKLDKFFKRQGVVSLALATVPENSVCVAVDNLKSKQSFPNILNCQGCFDNLKANCFWHQYFVLPKEKRNLCH